MKTVLIPTDFTLASLNMVKQAAVFFNGQRIKVVLFHALHMPADIHDLLSVSTRVPHEKITEPFRHDCAAIRKKHSDVIAGISFQYLYGNTTGVFRNFLEAHHIDSIFMPAHVQLRSAYPNSVEMRSLFKQANVPFITDMAFAALKSTSHAEEKKLMLAGV